VALTSLTLINNQCLPTRNTIEHQSELLRIGERLVGGDENMVFGTSGTTFDMVVGQLEVPDDFATPGPPIVWYNTNSRRPTLELPHPIGDSRVGNDHQRRRDIEFGGKDANESSNLNGFPSEIQSGQKEDLVGENRTGPFRPQECNAVSPTNYCTTSPPHRPDVFAVSNY